MNKLKSLVSKVLLAGAYSFASVNLAYADDTEIFFAPVSATSTKPNIMFAIDTSGSMAWIPGQQWVYPDEGEQSRMDIVKEVFDDVIVQLQNTNAGLMRFNGSAYGGPVLFPVLDLDTPANPIVTREVQEGEDDGVEDAAGNVNLTDDALDINRSTAKYTAIRFQDLGIPQGATITTAKIAFNAKNSDTGTTKTTIYAENVDDAPALTASDSSISTRATANRTVQAALWEPEDWTSGNSYVTSELASVVQEVINRPGWCGGNDLVIFIEGENTVDRQAYSADGEISAGGGESDGVVAPRLRVEFDNTLPVGANGCLAGETSVVINHSDDDVEEQEWNINDLDFYEDVEQSDGSWTAVNGKTGLRFRGIDVPQGATITEAYMTFTSRGGTRTEAASATIKALDSSSPGEPKYYLYSDAGFLSGGVSWTFTDWYRNQKYNTPSLVSLVQSIVNRGDWSAGNDMVFRIDGNSGDRRAHSYDGNSGKAPKLSVKYTRAYTPGSITMRQQLRDAVQELPADGATPIAGLIAEAAQYFAGKKVEYGKSRWSNSKNRISHELSYEAGAPFTPSNCTADNPNSSNCSGEFIQGTPVYKSPITEACQTSHLVYLTDGEANTHHTLTRNIYSSLSGGSSCSGSDSGEDCAKKLAGYMNTNDLSSLTGDQNVKTHMIGFSVGADPTLMRDMATAGGGGHYAAADKEQLVAALSQIIASISNVNTTFVTAGVTVNQYNRLTHNDQLYYSLFSPQSGSVWPGNVKRYRLNEGLVVDSNDADAVDPLSGEFSDSAKSWWSSEADGNDVREGGAAGELTVGRTIYSNISSEKSLIHADNRFNTTNITTALLGAANDNDRKTIIHWALGYDVSHDNYDVNDSSSLTSTPAHKDFGDPLHSQPTVLAYNSSTASKNKTVIYVGTNHGYLHAIDSGDTSGEEMWAFIPQGLLEQLTHIQKETVGNHRYGLDGSISIYLDDLNGNGAVDVDDGEKAYMYVGMRRGGTSYYALDISDPTEPKMMFTISPASTNFTNLGQTWSRPVVGKMNVSGVNSDKLVLMFGGGYDTDQDTEDTAANTDNVGNRVYIADAYSGAHLWDSSSITGTEGSSGPVSSMNAVPSEITAFDIDDDGFIDHMYAADTKAQIFRFDIDNTAQTIKGGRIASLQSAADAANNRRFYYSPDAALIRLESESFISISIGSGYRAHPLNETVTDHFYMIKDYGVLNGQFDMDVSLSNLTNITNLVGDGNNDGESDALAAINDESNPSKGWYLTFADTGEKVIERSITFNNAVIFTTYIPSSSGSCQAVTGAGRVYALQVVDGNPYVDTNYDGQLDASDRSVDLISSGIAPQPQIVYTDKPRLCVGTACTGGLLPDLIPPLPSGLTGIRWRKN